eukprot:16254-Chlamydomonas_euryale.AAC.1
MPVQNVVGCCQKAGTYQGGAPGVGAGVGGGVHEHEAKGSVNSHSQAWVNHLCVSGVDIRGHAWGHGVAIAHFQDTKAWPRFHTAHARAPVGIGGGAWRGA